jgi:5'-nucleotidase
MRILVTNDDGIHSPGLHALAAAVVASGHEVVVAAPSSDWSGASACLGPLEDPRRVPVEQVTFPVPDGSTMTGFSVGAPPALISMLADLGGFGEPPGMVVAGINRGPNTGRSTLFSATIGAVLAGEGFGWSGMAVSLDVAVPDGASPNRSDDGGPGREGPREPHWGTAAGLALMVLPWLVAAPQRTILNLNVPDAPPADVRGLRSAGLAPVGGVRTIITGIDDHGLDLDLIANDRPVPEGTDSAELAAGWMTVTSLLPTSTAGVALPLAEWSAAWPDLIAEAGSIVGP